MTSIEKINTTTSFGELTGLIGDDHVKVIRMKDVTISGDEDEAFAFSRAVRGHPSLEEVNLTNIKLATVGADLNLIVEMMLVSCPELSVIKLNNVPVRASSVGTLAYCESLTTLALINMGFNDVDAKLIADSVESNKSVTSVDLSGNRISDVGCKSLRLCLEKNSVIQEIFLDGNSITGAESGLLASKLQARVAHAA